ncbi:NUDIX domain-containing protein [Halosegnis longus]|uniref:NUDIX domain-containing protein n=1 Tax=Halosegnis longus TaxID=2216012 RepID=A0AAJ4R7F7_9EURY|nr:NUDIX domain-containing protein [Halosegnis longus]RNJ25620.1 NUDIX domain-containing protein [Salella cibi]
METVAVVTAFLRNRGEVLLLERSDRVGSYTGQWGAVAGHAEGDPDRLVRVEIAEETGLDDAVELVRRGEPFTVTDADRETEWRVHPYLFDCERRDVTPNEETSRWEWVPPTAIRERETVPDLWRSYDRVRPSVATVADDETHGAAYLSVRALDVLRDEAALANTGEAVATVARDLLDARASMHAVSNRINRVMIDAETPESVKREAISAIERAATADERAARKAAARLTAPVATLSRSGTVAQALTEADPDRLVVFESRPGGEGVDVAERFATGTDVTLAPDAAMADVLDRVGVESVIVGADTVLPDGRVVNKVGTRPLAAVANRAGVPVVVATATAKIAPEGATTVGREPRDDCYDGDVPLSVECPTFEPTPADHIDHLVTEDGRLGEEHVRDRAREHATAAAWCDR